ncbi:unnamed protein product [Notodromas monacha]|uniref:Uncharacterized protein n=1 Tax=Notodromas monacha TaxID=399045 RepID=A0A7R9BJT4_9CRUS|nr:unnamed protein product [Notodromas monacha]CAG0915284.1 unnamed protein product [Notodromas monacha]
MPMIVNGPGFPVDRPSLSRMNGGLPPFQRLNSPLGINSEESRVSDLGNALPQNASALFDKLMETSRINLPESKASDGTEVQSRYGAKIRSSRASGGKRIRRQERTIALLSRLDRCKDDLRSVYCGSVAELTVLDSKHDDTGIHSRLVCLEEAKRQQKFLLKGKSSGDIFPPNYPIEGDWFKDHLSASEVSLLREVARDYQDGSNDTLKVHSDGRIEAYSDFPEFPGAHVPQFRDVHGWNWGEYALSQTAMLRSKNRVNFKKIFDRNKSRSSTAVWKAKEVEILRRISELKSIGQWTENLLPRVLEPMKPKTAWDLMLDEMRAVSADFFRRRRWKKVLMKQLSVEVIESVPDFCERNERKRIAHSKASSSACAAMIRNFWLNAGAISEKQRLVLSDASFHQALQLQDRLGDIDVDFLEPNEIYAKTTELLEVKDRANDADFPVPDFQSIPLDDALLGVEDLLRAPEEIAGLQEDLMITLDELREEQTRARLAIPNVLDSDEESVEGGGNISQLVVSTESTEQVKRNAQRKTRQLRDLIKRMDALRPTETDFVRNTVPDSPFLRRKLFGYQLAGLRWLLRLHDKKLNGALADSHGLGKRLQVLALFAQLAANEPQKFGPNLIVTSASAMREWQLELLASTPEFRVLFYRGTPVSQRRLSAEVRTWSICVTSYRWLLKHHIILRELQWKYLVVEAPKNETRMLEHFPVLLDLVSQRRILLADSLECDLSQQVGYMSFLLPNAFGNEADVSSWLRYQNGADRLPKMLEGFSLRRRKSQVEDQLPPHFEHVEAVNMKPRQQSLYNDLMENPKTKEEISEARLVDVTRLLMHAGNICTFPSLYKPRKLASSFAIDSEAHVFDENLPNIYRGFIRKHEVLKLPGFRGQNMIENRLHLSKDIEVDGIDDLQKELLAVNRKESCFSMFRLFDPYVQDVELGTSGGSAKFTCLAERLVKKRSGIKLANGMILMAQKPSDIVKLSKLGTVFTNVACDSWERRPVEVILFSPKRIFLPDANPATKRFVMRVLSVALLSPTSDDQQPLASDEVIVLPLYNVIGVQKLPDSNVLLRGDLRKRESWYTLSGSTIVPGVSMDSAMKSVDRKNPFFASLYQWDTLRACIIASESAKRRDFLRAIVGGSCETRFDACDQKHFQTQCELGRCYTSVLQEDGLRKHRSEFDVQVLNAILKSVETRADEVYNYAGHFLVTVPNVVAVSSVNFPSQSTLASRDFLAGRLRRFLPRTTMYPERSLLFEESEKLSRLERILEEQRKMQNKVLIVARGCKQLDLLEKLLSFRKFSHLRVDETTSDFRAQMIAMDFRRNPRKFVLLLSSVFVGVLDVPSVKAVVLFDGILSPLQNHQCFQVSTEETVDFFRFVTRGTVEENIYCNKMKPQDMLSFLGENLGFPCFDKSVTDKLFGEPDKIVASDMKETNQIREEKPEECARLKEKLRALNAVLHAVEKPEMPKKPTQYFRVDEDCMDALRASDPLIKYASKVLEKELDGLSRLIEEAPLNRKRKMEEILPHLAKKPATCIAESSTPIEARLLMESWSPPTPPVGQSDVYVDVTYAGYESEPMIFEESEVTDGMKKCSSAVPVSRPRQPRRRGVAMTPALATPPRTPTSMTVVLRRGVRDVDVKPEVLFLSSSGFLEKASAANCDAPGIRMKATPSSLEFRILNLDKSADSVSLFDRPDVATVKLRRDAVRQRGKCLPPLPLPHTTVSKPENAVTAAIPRPPGSPGMPPLDADWTVLEDAVMLQCVQNIQMLAPHMATIFPAQTGNWDLITSMLNLAAALSRPEGVCLERFKHIVVPREEEASNKTSKSGTAFDGVGSSRMSLISSKRMRGNQVKADQTRPPMRTLQLYQLDNNASMTRLHMIRLEGLKRAANSKRKTAVRRVDCAAAARLIGAAAAIKAMQPHQQHQHQHHQQQQQQAGLQYTPELTPKQIATRRAQHVAREKQKAAEMARIQQLIGPKQVVQQQQQNEVCGQPQQQSILHQQLSAAGGRGSRQPTPLSTPPPPAGSPATSVAPPTLPVVLRDARTPSRVDTRSTGAQATEVILSQQPQPQQQLTPIRSMTPVQLRAAVGSPGSPRVPGVTEIPVNTRAVPLQALVRQLNDGGTTNVLRPALVRATAQLQTCAGPAGVQQGPGHLVTGSGSRLEIVGGLSQDGQTKCGGEQCGIVNAVGFTIAPGMYQEEGGAAGGDGASSSSGRPSGSGQIAVTQNSFFPVALTPCCPAAARNAMKQGFVVCQQTNPRSGDGTELVTILRSPQVTARVSSAGSTAVTGSNQAAATVMLSAQVQPTLSSTPGTFSVSQSPQHVIATKSSQGTTVMASSGTVTAIVRPPLAAAPGVRPHRGRSTILQQPSQQTLQIMQGSMATKSLPSISVQQLQQALKAQSGKNAGLGMVTVVAAAPSSSGQSSTTAGVVRTSGALIDAGTQSGPRSTPGTVSQATCYKPIQILSGNVPGLTNVGTSSGAVQRIDAAGRPVITILPDGAGQIKFATASSGAMTTRVTINASKTTWTQSITQSGSSGGNEGAATAVVVRQPVTALAQKSASGASILASSPQYVSNNTQTTSTFTLGPIQRTGAVSNRRTQQPFSVSTGTQMGEEQETVLIAARPTSESSAISSVASTSTTSLQLYTSNPLNITKHILTTRPQIRLMHAVQPVRHAQHQLVAVSAGPRQHIVAARLPQQQPQQRVTIPRVPGTRMASRPQVITSRQIPVVVAAAGGSVSAVRSPGVPSCAVITSHEPTSRKDAVSSGDIDKQVQENLQQIFETYQKQQLEKELVEQRRQSGAFQPQQTSQGVAQVPSSSGLVVRVEQQQQQQLQPQSTPGDGVSVQLQYHQQRVIAVNRIRPIVVATTTVTTTTTTTTTSMKK